MPNFPTVTNMIHQPATADARPRHRFMPVFFVICTLDKCYFAFDNNTMSISHGSTADNRDNGSLLCTEQWPIWLHVVLKSLDYFELKKAPALFLSSSTRDIKNIKNAKTVLISKHI